MKLYGGIDLHSNNCVIAIINEQGEMLSCKRLNNDMSVILSFLSPYKDKLTGLVVESTFNWYWLVDALMDAEFKLHLANPAAIQQYSGLKYADDHSDARWLAEMLRLDILPEGYIYPRELRAVRDLMRKRMDIVQQSTKNLLSVQSCLSEQKFRRLSHLAFGTTVCFYAFLRRLVTIVIWELFYLNNFRNRFNDQNDFFLRVAHKDATVETSLTINKSREPNHAIRKNHNTQHQNITTTHTNT